MSMGTFSRSSSRFIFSLFLSSFSHYSSFPQKKPLCLWLLNSKWKQLYRSHAPQSVLFFKCTAWISNEFLWNRREKHSNLMHNYNVTHSMKSKFVYKVYVVCVFFFFFVSLLFGLEIQFAETKDFECDGSLLKFINENK